MSVFQKGNNGKWYCDFIIDGRRTNKACKGATSRKEAIKYENEMKSAVMHGDLNFVKKKCTIKLSEMIEKYLEYSKTNKPASFSHDKFYKKYWLEYFSDKMLTEIKPIDIEGYKTYRIETAKVKPSTVNREFNSLSKMFSIAKQNEYIENNPCSLVKRFKVENFKIRYLTKDEQKRLFKVIGDHWIKPIITMALHTGCRKSEILNLEWRLVNFEERYIDILKTKSGKPRQIPMSDKLYEALNSLSRVNEYVFINPITKNRHGNIQDIFSDFIKTAEIKNFTFHDLRHTAATRMVECGIDLIVVKEVLGHADIHTTMRYAHPVPEIKLKAIKALNDY